MTSTMPDRADNNLPAPMQPMRRRTALKTDGIGAPAGLRAAAGTLGPASSALAGTPNRATRRRLGNAGDAPDANESLDPTGTPVLNPTPYSLEASCELSDDYFSTYGVVLGDADDLVLPFTGPDGSEALVLANQNLYYLHRDPGQPGGWTYIQVDIISPPPYTDSTPTVSAAVAANNSDQVFMGAVQSYGGQDYFIAYQRQDDGSFGQLQPDRWDGSGQWPPLDSGTPTAIKASVSGDGATVTFYAVSGNGTVYQWQVYENEDNGMVWSSFVMDSLQGQVQPTDAFVISSLHAPWDRCGVAILDAGGDLTWYQQTGTTSYDTIGTTMDNGIGVSNVIWVVPSPDTTAEFPCYVFQDKNGGLHFSYQGEIQDVMDDVGDTAGAGRAAAWMVPGSLPDEELFHFVYIDQDNDNTANVLTQAEDGSYTPLIPLRPHLLRLYNSPSDPTEGTLFVVDEALTLNVLSRDGSTGVWQMSPVYQQSPQTNALDCWRTQITVTDANGSAVLNAPVRLTSNLPIGAWLAPSSNAFFGTAPVTLTADTQGHLTFSVPAVELDTASLVAQVLDSNGNPSGDPLTITPDFDVHNYMQGSTPINQLSNLDGSAVLDAKASDGSALLSVVTTIKDPTTRQSGGRGCRLGDQPRRGRRARLRPHQSHRCPVGEVRPDWCHAHLGDLHHPRNLPAANERGRRPIGLLGRCQERRRVGVPRTAPRRHGV